jgi:hypothetical protein
VGSDVLPYVFQVTKYDPADRDQHGHYTGTEDTASDHGPVETACLQAVAAFAEDSDVDQLAIREPQLGRTVVRLAGPAHRRRHVAEAGRPVTTWMQRFWDEEAIWLAWDRSSSRRPSSSPRRAQSVTASNVAAANTRPLITRPHQTSEPARRRTGRAVRLGHARVSIVRQTGGASSWCSIAELNLFT